MILNLRKMNPMTFGMMMKTKKMIHGTMNSRRLKKFGTLQRNLNH